MRAVALSLLILMLLPLQALAHAQLRGAEPPAGALRATAPAELVLSFNEPIAPLQARWFAPDGSAVDVESRAVGPDLIITPPAALREGTQALSWRVVSDDGHPVGGTHVFSIGFHSGTPETAAAAINPAAGFAALARGLLTLALVMGVGGMLWAELSQRPAPSAIRLALAAVAPASLLLLAAQAIDLAGEGPGSLLQPAVWALAVASPFALTAGLAMLAAALAASGRCWTLRVAWVLAAASFASAGHAARAEPVALMAALVFVHALALIFWAGALPGLIAALRAPDAAALMVRFSRRAVPMVALLVLSGAALAWRQVETPGALWGTAYGWVLMAKLALVALVLALAARHRLRLTPALAIDPATTRPAFARSLRRELLLMLAILALTAGFRLTPPPRAMAEPPQTRVELHLHGRDAMADITLIPGRPGQNRLEITPLDGDFQPFVPLELVLFLSIPAAGLERMELRASPDDDGLWHAGPVHLPQPGPWDVVADILITDFRKALIGGEFMLLP